MQGAPEQDTPQQQGHKISYNNHVTSSKLDKYITSSHTLTIKQEDGWKPQQS